MKDDDKIEVDISRLPYCCFYIKVNNEFDNYSLFTFLYKSNNPPKPYFYKDE